MYLILDYLVLEKHGLVSDLAMQILLNYNLRFVLCPDLQVIYMLFFIVLILVKYLVLLVFYNPNRLLAWISLLISINSLLLEIVLELYL